MSDTTHQLGRTAHGGAVIDGAGGQDYAHYRVVPATHHARTAGTVLAIVLIGVVLNSVLGNPRWGWGVFAQWFLAAPVLSGLGRTLVLTALRSFSSTIPELAQRRRRGHWPTYLSATTGS